MPDDEPDITAHPLQLSEDLTVTELVVLLEHALMRRDDRCSICLDRGVRDYIVQAIKQRSSAAR